MKPQQQSCAAAQVTCRTYATWTAVEIREPTITWLVFNSVGLTRSVHVGFDLRSDLRPDPFNPARESGLLNILRTSVSEILKIFFILISYCSKKSYNYFLSPNTENDRRRKQK